MGLIIGLLILAVYFIPSIFAYKDKKKNRQAILLLNLLAGWTVVGYIVALIWAATKDTPSTIVAQKSDASELEKLATLKEKGVLTEDEFNKKKKQLLGS